MQKIFHRLLQVTLDGLIHSTNHPLAREIRFQIILFGLKVLRYSTRVSAVVQWRLKNHILSAALSWFSFAPRWSFGGNRLQLKAEMRLMADVAAALLNVRPIGLKSVGPLTSLLAKEELLTVLLENEQTRLAVWLNPLGGGTNSIHKDPSDVSLLVLLDPFVDADINSGHTFKCIKDRLGRQPLYSSTSDEEIPLAKDSQ
jgi:phosphatidylinositol 4-kinase A